MNIDRLRNDLFESGFARQSGGGDKCSHTADELIAVLLELNDRLLTKPDDFWLSTLPPARRPAAAKALDKARQHRFMLGMDNRWLHEIPEPGLAKTV